jgi:2-methylisocitrate lyase-like PEP mutase family enzyme
MIEDKPFLTCPGIFDLVSAKLADRTGADALYMTGYGAVVWAFENRCAALGAE